MLLLGRLAGTSKRRFVLSEQNEESRGGVLVNTRVSNEPIDVSQGHYKMVISYTCVQFEVQQWLLFADVFVHIY